MRRRASLGTIALAVLAVAAVVLAVTALRETRGAPAPSPSSSAFEPQESQTKEPRKTSEPDSPGDALPPNAEAPLLMADPNVAYRGRAGTCLGGARMEKSVDGGVNWERIDVPAQAVLSMTAPAAGQVVLIGADEQCRIREWTSTDGAVSWSAPNAANGVFVRVPDSVRHLMTPTGKRSNPCPDPDVAPLAIDSVTELDAFVLCQEGVVMRTGDGGRTWDSASTVSGAEAMAFESPELGWVVVRGSGRCAGYELQRTGDGAATWTQGNCIGEAPTADGTLPSLSFSDPTTGMVVVADLTYVTDDSGYRWTRAR